MNDEYNDLLRAIQRKPQKGEPMKLAVPPALPDEKRLNEEDINRAVKRFRELKAQEETVN